MTRVLFLILLMVFVGLQGCSLLFLAKGKTGMSAVQSPEVPKARSLSKEMNRKDVIHYQTEEGDSIAFLGKVFYGSSSGARKLAEANRLNVHSRLKPGRILRVVNPWYFPDADEIKHQRETLKVKMIPAGMKSGAGSESVFSTADSSENEMSLTKVSRPKVNRAFTSGEKLVYEVKALSMVAGMASLEVGNFVTIHDRPCYPLIARAKAAFPFNAIYPVKDVQTSYFDTVDFLTWKFENDVSEGSYKAHNLEFYDQVKHQLIRRHNDEKIKECDIPPFTQDLISCFYYFRLLPIEVGKKYMVPTSSTGKNYNLVIEVIKREKITIPLGTFDCFLVKPFVKHDTVFRNAEDIDMWLTADSRHIPILIKSGIVIGNIEISLLQATLPEIKEASEAAAMLRPQRINTEY